MDSRKEQWLEFADGWSTVPLWLAAVCGAEKDDAWN